MSGDVKILYDGRRKKYVLLRALEDGYAESIVGSYKKVSEAYEQTYGGSITEIHGNLESLRGTEGSDIWDLQLPRNGGDDAGDGASIGGEGLQSDPAGDDKHLLRGDRGVLQEVKPSTRNKSNRELLSEALPNTHPSRNKSGATGNRQLRRRIFSPERFSDTALPSHQMQSENGRRQQTPSLYRIRWPDSFFQKPIA